MILLGERKRVNHSLKALFRARKEIAMMRAPLPLFAKIITQNHMEVNASCLFSKEFKKKKRDRIDLVINCKCALKTE